jgi:succinate dehydrogenase hydrophobic anchor subunit
VKCHSHPHADAVASCVSCGQGLCSECVKRTPGGLFVCGDPCRKLANMKNVAVEFEIEGVRIQRRSYEIMGLLCRVMALILLLLVLVLLGSAIYHYRVRPMLWKEQIAMDSVGIVIFFLLAAMMFFGAVALRKIAQRYGEILKRVDEP